MKTRRQDRLVKLRAHSLLPFEARPLSRVPFKVCPYIGYMMRDRWKMFLRAKQLGTTQRQWEAQIKELYRVNGWTKRNRAGIVTADPWKMFRDYEEKFKAKYPEYESPWMKKYRNWKDFLAKIERTMKAQRQLA